MGTTAETKDVVIGVDLHRRAKTQASVEGRSLKALVTELLEKYLEMVAMSASDGPRA